jgi:hypothetical protein
MPFLLFPVPTVKVELREVIEVVDAGNMKKHGKYRRCQWMCLLRQNEMRGPP